MKSRVSRSRVSQDRWLVSYADFITLLFGLFVVLYAFARADQKKQFQVSQAIDSAFRSIGGLHAAARQPAGADAEDSGQHSISENSAAPEATENVLASAEVKDDLERLRLDLTQVLARQVAAHAISLEMSREGLVISLREAGFFDSGSATPKPETLPALQEIALKLGATPYDLRIEGHTDNLPIHNAGFNSNWELSTARATSIARMLFAMNVISPERVSVAGYGEYHPVATNESAEGRAENRRVDLVVMPRTNLNFSAPSVARPQGAWRRITDGD